ncbi:MAG: hypothetical protein JW839_16865 [Candidatus Lokiarchaeota archaeon]|nr:hypothetical protein [Candidatus Lokiarchaeota archaeon]
MVLLLDTMPYSVEMHIISAFVLVVLGSEIALVLVMHRRRNPESGVPAIRACLVGVRTFVAMNGVELVSQLFYGTIPESRMLIYLMFLVIIDVGCVALFARLRPFVRNRPILFRVVLPLEIALSSVVLVFHAVELLSVRSIAILPDLVSIGLASPIIVGPIILVVFLYAHGDREIKPYYKFMMLALAMLGFGGATHLVPIEDGLAGIGIGLDATAFVSMAFSVTGVAIFLGTVYVMPYIEDIYWRKAVLAVYVVDAGTGSVVFKREFKHVEEMALSGMQPSDRDSALMGGLSGIDDLVREMTNDSGGRLELIDKEGLKFMLSWYKQLLFVAISRINLPVIKAKLAEFKNHCITQFGELVKQCAVSESQRVDLGTAAARIFQGGGAA